MPPRVLLMGAWAGAAGAATTAGLLVVSSALGPNALGDADQFISAAQAAVLTLVEGDEEPDQAAPADQNALSGRPAPGGAPLSTSGEGQTSPGLAEPAEGLRADAATRRDLEAAAGGPPAPVARVGAPVGVEAPVTGVVTPVASESPPAAGGLPLARPPASRPAEARPAAPAAPAQPVRTGLERRSGDDPGSGVRTPDPAPAGDATGSGRGQDQGQRRGQGKGQGRGGDVADRPATGRVEPPRLAAPPPAPPAEDSSGRDRARGRSGEDRGDRDRDDRRAEQDDRRADRDDRRAERDDRSDDDTP